MLPVMRDARCLLFFPGTRPELLPKALRSGAPLVCLDLEDAVAPEHKGAAREHARKLLAGDDVSTNRVSVRINHPSTPAGDDDLRMLLEITTRGNAAERPQALTVLIPKVDAAEDVAAVRERWTSKDSAPNLVAAIESARGLARVEDVATAPGVSGLLFGGLDLSLDLGTALDWEALLYARSRTVLAARIADVVLMDTPHFDLDAEASLTAEARRARRLGFTGKAAIHPSQVAPILAAFSPSASDVAAAKRILEARARAEGGVFTLDGVMVDRPAVEAARRVVASAGAPLPEDDRRGGP